MDTTLTLSYDSQNHLAKKVIDFILSLGVFTVKQNDATKEEALTLKTIEDARKGIDVIDCGSYENYLKMVSEI